MKENSIERDIHLLESYAGMTHKMNDNQGRPKLDQAIDHILSDYKRVLKENEELKQDRNNNYQMIALAQNEVLGYMQGYEDGKKLKRSAVANIVENQQYYIFNKQIEHYKEYIVKLQKENKELKEYISIAPNLDKMTAVKYRNIQQDAYIKGRAEEQHRLFEAIMKIADQREELKKTCYTMAEYIVKLDIDEDICKHIKCSEGDKEREECIECVINHFKNK